MECFGTVSTDRSSSAYCFLKFPNRIQDEKDEFFAPFHPGIPVGILMNDTYKRGSILTRRTQRDQIDAACQVRGIPPAIVFAGSLKIADYDLTFFSQKISHRKNYVPA